MTTPKYTFLLPAFKGKYLDEMLKSIKAQTYQDFKVLISNDCSPEDLRSICEPYLSDPRFSYRRNEENMGSKSLVSHWNLLVDMCDTEYLIMASDDDVYEPQFLAEIDALVQKYPNVDLFRARVDFIDESGQRTKVDGVYSEYEDNLGYLSSHFSKVNLKCLANHVFRTRKLKQLHGFHDTPLAWYSDQITAIEMSDNGCCNTSTVLFHFRMSGTNISSAKNTKATASKKAVATLYADRWFVEYLKKNNITTLSYSRWGRMIYYWLMDADFKTFVCLFPKIIKMGLWNTDWMLAITRHQIKTLMFK